MPLKIALLASGTGSNAKAILRAIREGRLDAEAACLISNNADAPALTMAAEAGIPAIALPHQGLSREAHEQQILDALAPYDVDYLVLAGYMRLMTPLLLNAFKTDTHYRIVNIHPALLPSFPGAHGYADAFAYGVKISGITVHFVDEGMDTGPILLQAPFERKSDDTLDTFKARGLALEHQVYPQALQLIAENRVRFVPHPETGRPLIEVKTHVPC